MNKTQHLAIEQRHRSALTCAQWATCSACAHSVAGWIKFDDGTDGPDIRCRPPITQVQQAPCSEHRRDIGACGPEAVHWIARGVK